MKLSKKHIELIEGQARFYTVHYGGRYEDWLKSCYDADNSHFLSCSYFIHPHTSLEGLNKWMPEASSDTYFGLERTIPFIKNTMWERAVMFIRRLISR